MRRAGTSLSDLKSLPTSATHISSITAQPVRAPNQHTQVSGPRISNNTNTNNNNHNNSAAAVRQVKRSVVLFCNIEFQIKVPAAEKSQSVFILAIRLNTSDTLFPVYKVNIRLPANLNILFKFILSKGDEFAFEAIATPRRFSVVDQDVCVDCGEFGILSECVVHSDRRPSLTRDNSPNLPNTASFKSVDRLRHTQQTSSASSSPVNVIHERMHASVGSVLHPAVSLDGFPSKTLTPTGASISPSTALTTPTTATAATTTAATTAGTATSNATLFLVIYRLPIRAKRNATTKDLEFMWDDSALYFTAPGLRDGLKGKYMHTRWIGIIDDVVIDSDERAGVGDLLLERFNCIPVFLPPAVKDLFYISFCKGVLWPTFHHATEIGDQTKPFNHQAWQAYQTVNSIFANKVIELYTEDDVVWIHDYHLLVVAQYLRRRPVFDHGRIALYLHVPFPSSEIFRMLPCRIELLSGMLCASLLGFQMFEYARHFLTSCKRLLGIEYFSRRGGFLGVEYQSRQVLVRISHIGIDPTIFTRKLEKESVRAKSLDIQKKYQGCTIFLGIDNIDRLKGITLKLMAIECLLQDYPRYRDNLVLIQIGIPRFNSTTFNDEVRNNTIPELMLSKEIRSLVERINSAYSNAKTGYVPIVYIEQDITLEDRISYYSIADGVILTCVRDALNLIPYEYVMCKEDQKRGILIISEFTGCSRSLSSAVRVNPFGIRDVAEAIDAAFGIDESERRGLHARDKAYVSEHTTTVWAINFLHDIESCGRQAGITYLGIDLSLRRLEATSEKLKKLEQADVIRAYNNSRNRLLVLDYEGTLVPLRSKAMAISELSEETIENLQYLGNDPKNTVFMVTGRQKKVLDPFLDQFHSLGFAVEHGYEYKWPRSRDWTTLLTGADFSWKSIAAKICEPYAERTDGSFLEIKDSALAWRFIDADPDLGESQAKELLSDLHAALDNQYDVEIHKGKGLIEVHPRGVNKGVMVDRIVSELSSKSSTDENVNNNSSNTADNDDNNNSSSHASSANSGVASASSNAIDFVLCVGDDKSDEHMFAYLNSKYGASNAVTKVFTVTVGKKPSQSRFYVDTATEATDLLNQLRLSSLKFGRVQSAVDLKTLHK